MACASFEFDLKPKSRGTLFDLFKDVLILQDELQEILHTGP